MSELVGLSPLATSQAMRVMVALETCVSVLASASAALVDGAELVSLQPAADQPAQQWALALDAQASRLKELLRVLGGMV